MAEQVSRSNKNLDEIDIKKYSVPYSTTFWATKEWKERDERLKKAIDEMLPPKTETDMVNNPPHYTAHPSGIECIQVTEHMSFNVGNAVKYLWRCDHKGNALEDLKKARFYVQREIERREIAERNAELARGGDETPEPL